MQKCLHTNHETNIIIGLKLNGVLMRLASHGHALADLCTITMMRLVYDLLTGTMRA
jgi:hypothetical protein